MARRVGSQRAAARERLRVAVVMGGIGAEREVSLSTGKAVVGALDPASHAVRPAIIARSARWRVAGAWLDDPAGPWGPMEDLGPDEALGCMLADGIDVAFLALHGPLGEDGTAQGFFEFAGIPYTGPRVEAAVLAMNKAVSRRLLAAAGLRVPEGVEVPAGAAIEGIPAAVPGPPWVVKPARLGSSIGVSIVRRPDALADAVGKAAREDTLVLVESFIPGLELSCPVLDRGGGPEPLPVVAIEPAGGHAFFDYRAKYLPGEARETVPAPIGAAATRRVQEAAVAAHRALGCGVLSRTDLILDAAEEPVALETNTIPGLTGNSLVPKCARAAGIPFPRLLDHLVGDALRHAGRQRTRATAGA